MPQLKYRIALLVDALEVDAWVRDLAGWAKDHPAIELAAVIVQPPTGSDALDYLLALESRVVRCAGSRHSIAGCAPVQIVARDEADLLRIEELRFDALIQCGRAPPQEGMVEAAMGGAISIVTHSERGASGFVEVLEGRPVTEFAIERLNAGGSEILFRGSITTQLFYSQNRAALYERAAPYLMRVVERLARDEAQAQSARSFDTEGRDPPGAGDLLTYAARTLARVARKAWRHAVGREWNWGVAYAFAPWQSADLSAGHVLPKLAGTFVADPFAVDTGGKRYIFVEEFPYSTRKGVISVFEVDKEGARRLGVALEEPYHLSFPFLFRKDGRFYMVPEGQGGAELILYECEDFPLKWSRRKVLMARVCADAVIFEHGSLWWMLTTIKGGGRGENSAELHAFHAEDPLGEWRPHRMNPVVMDASKGRNGGLLRDDEGRVCRVAQRAGFRTYGNGFAIYGIDELTPDSYRESPVREVRPDFFPRLAGAHHIHSDGSLTVYDFSRDERP